MRFVYTPFPTLRVALRAARSLPSPLGQVGVSFVGVAPATLASQPHGCTQPHGRLTRVAGASGKKAHYPPESPCKQELSCG